MKRIIINVLITNLIMVVSGCGLGTNTTTVKKNVINTSAISDYTKSTSKGLVGYIVSGDKKNNVMYQIITNNYLKYDYHINNKLIFDGHNSLLKISDYQGGSSAINVQNSLQTLKLLKIFEKSNIDIMFIEAGLANNEDIYQQLKNSKQKYIIIGKNAHIITGSKFKFNDLPNVTPISFSHIISAYMTGYQLQTSYGFYEISAGEKERQNVFYTLIISKSNDKTKNVINNAKAEAFRQGVLAASKDFKTLKPKFLQAKDISEKKAEQTLIWYNDDAVDILIPALKKTDIIDTEQAIFYHVGIQGETNTNIATALSKIKISSDAGHIYIAEQSYENNNHDEKISKIFKIANIYTNAIPAPIDGTKVTAWVGMAYEKSGNNYKFSHLFTENIKFGTKYAILKVLSILYGAETQLHFFDKKVNYYGDFALHYNPVFKWNAKTKKQAIKNIFSKKLDEEMFKKNEEINE